MEKLETRFKKFISRKPNRYSYFIQNGLVYCCGNVFITDEDLIKGKLPFEFGEVYGNFDCSGCKNLTSLEGCPKEVGGDFDCNYCCSLNSLVGSPKKVGGEFSCVYCDSLNSLFGSPQEVCGDFNCRHCKKLTSFVFSPDYIGGIIRVSEDMNLDVDVDVD